MRYSRRAEGRHVNTRHSPHTTFSSCISGDDVETTDKGQENNEGGRGEKEGCNIHPENTTCNVEVTLSTTFLRVVLLY